ncbi:Adenylate kinase 7, partial [Coelomomyces lativittatus]
MTSLPVFIPAVDTPVLHELARLLANLKVGTYRVASDAAQEPEIPNSGDGGPPHESHSNKFLDKNATSYKVSGTHVNSILHEEPLPPEMLTYFEDDIGKNELTRELKDSILVPGKPLGKWISSSFPNSDKEAFKSSVLQSKIIILDLLYSVEDAETVLEILKENAAQFVDNPKTIIIISTVMTWGRTKPDPEDPSSPLAEDEFRRRKPHPNFRQHLECEKSFIQLNKLECYKSYVLFSGLVYHVGDCVFHSLFKRAWQGNQEITVYGDGENFLPMIHLTDLCRLVFTLIENHPNMKYILAVDDAKSTYADVAR